MTNVCGVWGGWAPDTGVGADGAAAWAGAVSKLVNLTSLNLEGTWNVEWAASRARVCVCACVRAVLLLLWL